MQLNTAVSTSQMEQTVVDTWRPRSPGLRGYGHCRTDGRLQHASASPGRDILGVVDHEAAAASLIRGGSAEEATCVG